MPSEEKDLADHTQWIPQRHSSRARLLQIYLRVYTGRGVRQSMKPFVIPWGGLLSAIYFQSGFIATPIPDGAGLEMEF